MPECRRSYGTGSITKRGDLWVGRLNLGTRPDGKRHRPAVYGKTKQEVQRKLADLRRTHEVGQLVTPSKETVGAWLTIWLETVQRPRLAPSSYAREAAVIRNHLVPALGSVRLTALQPETIQAVYAGWALAPRTIKLHHAVLHKALAVAVRWGKLARNPADLVSLPKVERHQPTVLDEGPARRFLQVVRGDEREALYVTALGTGLRIGELLGLRWAAVDLEQRVLRVESKIVHVDRAIVEGPPKTPRALREIPLLPPVVAALRTHRAQQRMAQAAAAVWERPDLVFPGRHGQPLRAGFISSIALPRLLKRAALPRMSMHDLRHSAASLWRKRGAPIEVVSELLGHSSAAITLGVYRHVFSGETSQAIDLLADLFEDKMDTNRDTSAPSDANALAE